MPIILGKRFRGRVRRGLRRRGSLLTLSNLTIAFILAILIYAIVGSIIAPILLLTMITLTAPWLLVQRMRVAEAIAASLLSTAIAGSILLYSTSLKPVINIVDVHIEPLLANTMLPVALTLLGLLTGGLASHGAAIYYFYIILKSISEGIDYNYISGILAWVLLSYTTVASALLLKTMGRTEYIKSRTMISLIIIITALLGAYYITS